MKTLFKPIFKPMAQQTGFSLIELMVGMTVGLIVTLVVSQVFGTFQGQQRATSGTGDAQTNGSIALYSISRDMQMAGYGLMASEDAHSPLECTTVDLDAEAIANAGMTVAAGIENLSAVTITDGAVSDTVTVRYGDSPLGGIPTGINTAPSGQVLRVGSNLNCKGGDFAVITQGTSCAVTRLANPQVTPTVDSTTEIVIDASETMPVQAVAGGSNISCLGNWRTRTFSVANGVLQLNGNDLTAGIVSIQAQYGISPAADDNAVAQWVEPTGTWAAGAMTAADRNRIKAVRIAVIAQNAQRENAAITNACDTSTTPSTGLCAWEGTAAVVGPPAVPASPAPTFDLSTADANWANYRYRVFETIIPLRNVVWSRSTLTP